MGVRECDERARGNTERGEGGESGMEKRKVLSLIPRPSLSSGLSKLQRAEAHNACTSGDGRLTQKPLVNARHVKRSLV
jgi:hypothetical protein